LYYLWNPGEATEEWRRRGRRGRGREAGEGLGWRERWQVVGGARKGSVIICKRVQFETNVIKRRRNKKG